MGSSLTFSMCSLLIFLIEDLSSPPTPSLFQDMVGFGGGLLHQGSGHCFISYGGHRTVLLHSLYVGSTDTFCLLLGIWVQPGEGGIQYSACVLGGIGEGAGEEKGIGESQGEAHPQGDDGMFSQELRDTPPGRVLELRATSR